MTRIPPPLFNQRVLDALVTAQVERGEPISDLWFRLTRRLDARSAEMLPLALGLAAPMIAGDKDRLRLLGSLAVAYDLFELAGHLLPLAEALGDARIALDVAALAAHPGVPAEVRDRVARLRATLPDDLRPPFDVRLDPDATSSDEGRWLAAQRWPGMVERVPRDYVGAPLVAVAEEGLPRDVVFQLLHALRRHGALVRRIPAAFARTPDPRWLGTWSPIGARSAAILGNLRRQGFTVNAAQFVLIDEKVVEARRGRDFLVGVDDVLSRFGAPRIRVPDPRTEISLQSAPLDFGVFQLGAYDTREVALLSGFSPTTVRRWPRLEALRPDKVAGSPYWHFSQLVAMRTYKFVHSLHRKRLSFGVLEELAGFAGRDRPVELGVTSDAIVVFEEDGAYELRSGQRVLEASFKLEASFQAFTVGGGMSVPGLLKPTDHTRTHPAVLGGTPRIQGTRLACRGVAEAFRRRRPDRVHRLYPTISPEVLNEAREIGARIIGDKALR